MSLTSFCPSSLPYLFKFFVETFGGRGDLEMKSCACFCFLSARIKGVCHHAWPKKLWLCRNGLGRDPVCGQASIYWLLLISFSCWLCLFWGTLMWRLTCFSEMGLAFLELQKLFWGRKQNRKELLFANTCLFTGFFITGMWLRSFKILNLGKFPNVTTL